MAGYTRQDTANNIANGNVIDADDFDAEYNAVENAFNASAGHKHDGSAGEGAPIEKVGPSQELVVSSTNVNPKTSNTLDLGTNLLQYKDGYFDGTVYQDSAIVGVNAYMTLSDNEIDVSTGGLTLDAAGDITLDADGGDVLLKDAGTTFGTFTNTGNNLVVKSGSTTAITLSGADATLAGTLAVTGATTLNGAVTVSGSNNVTVNSGDVTLSSGDLIVGGTITSTGAIVANGGVTGTVSSISNHDTGDLSEGSNLYHTTARARGAISATDAGGDGSLSYNSTSGVITYTGPSAAQVRAHFSAGEGIDISNGSISGENASTSNKGIASFDTTDFVVSSGAVSLRHSGVEDIVGGMVSGNSEAGISVTYQTSDNTLDFNVNDPTISLTGAVTGSATMTNLGNVSIATTATSDPTITLTGAVTGSGTMTNLGNVSISTSATADPTLTLTGDVTGSATFTNLGSASLTATVANDSHTHDGRYYTETESDSRFTASAGDVMTGNLRFNDNVAATFGTSNDMEVFVNGSHAYMDLNSGIGNLYIRDGSTTRYTFNDNGNFTSTGSATASAFYYSSDERLKENIAPVTGALDVITNLRGVEFDWKEDGTHDIGVIAQEVEAHIPEAVTQSEDTDHKTVSAAPIIAYLIEAVKELKAEVDRLNDKP